MPYDGALNYILLKVPLDPSLRMERAMAVHQVVDLVFGLSDGLDDEGEDWRGELS